MSHLKAGFVFAFSYLAVLVNVQQAEAAQTASATVNCPRSSLQAAIDAVSPGVTTTIKVSGTCSELIEVPSGKTIVLQGDGKAELKPPADKADQPVLVNRGKLQLERMKVTNTAAAANVILALDSSSLVVLGSTISGSNAEIALEIANSSSGRIFNSVVRGGAGESVGVYNGGTVEIFGRPSMLSHFDSSIGYKSVISNNSAAVSAISCGDGSNLAIKTDGTGKVKVSNTAGTGIGMQLCSFRARNNSGSGGIDVSAKGKAVSAMLSDLFLMGVTLSSQTEYAFWGSEARVIVTGSSFNKSGSGDIWLEGESNIKFNGWSGASALPAAFDGSYQSLSCADDSRIFAGDYDLSLPGGRTMGELKRAYPDCFLP